MSISLYLHALEVVAPTEMVQHPLFYSHAIEINIKIRDCNIFNCHYNIVVRATIDRGRAHIYSRFICTMGFVALYGEGAGVGVEAGFCNRGGVFKVDNEWMCGCCSRNAEKEGV